MKKTFIAIFMTVSLLFMVGTEAVAARLGGGGAFGRMSTNIGRPAPMISPNAGGARSMESRQAGYQNQNMQNQGGAVAQRRSGFGGLLGGALMGLGLGYLLSNMGFSEGASNIISTILMLAIIFFGLRFVMRWLANRRMEKHQQDYYHYYHRNDAVDSRSGNIETPEIGSGINGMGGAVSADTGAWGIPSDFDVPGFLRAAKANFIRLQAAWDKKDINDLHQFTTPEMFAELRLQLEERGDALNVTDVIDLDADLLGIETFQNEYMASVRFTGKIRENPNASAEPFEEIWNMTRPISKESGWVLAGIQQA
ncbi:MAG: Tim44 domain-containing protein [Oxalobacter sp.]|nr:Tim44 domain-containing protein [Oxalobacter sp.]